MYCLGGFVLSPLSSELASSLSRIVDRIFSTYDDVSYIAVVSEKLEVIAQKGFIDLHPSNLHILHVQAGLLVNMSSVWSESLGTLDYICASFGSKSEIVAMPLQGNMQLVVVLSSVHKHDRENIRLGIVNYFRSVRIRP